MHAAQPLLRTRFGTIRSVGALCPQPCSLSSTSRAGRHHTRGKPRNPSHLRRRDTDVLQHTKLNSDGRSLSTLAKTPPPPPTVATDSTTSTGTQQHGSDSLNHTELCLPEQTNHAGPESTKPQHPLISEPTSITSSSSNTPSNLTPAQQKKLCAVLANSFATAAVTPTAAGLDMSASDPLYPSIDAARDKLDGLANEYVSFDNSAFNSRSKDSLLQARNLFKQVVLKLLPDGAVTVDKLSNDRNLLKDAATAAISVVSGSTSASAEQQLAASESVDFAATYELAPVCGTQTQQLPAAAAEEMSQRVKHIEVVTDDTSSTIPEDDRQAVNQTAPRMPGRERDLHVKLLLVGESGLGKTTLTRQMLCSYAQGGADIALGHDGSSSSMEQFKSDPDSLCTELKPVVVPDKNLRLLLKIQDMPGWGDDINVHRYLQTVINYIMQQRAADYDELKGDRAFEKQYVAGCLTQSVTACLYFLPPHRTKPVDLILMSALSQQVILIPVIAKADTMTQKETERYRQEILDRCLKPDDYVNRSNTGIPELKINLFRFDDDDLQALQVHTTVPPFTIITSEHLNEDDRPVRKYLWGECDATNRKHSDFILLKRLLMGDKVNSLWRMLDDSYDRYVSFAGAYEAAGHNVAPLVMAACAVCGPLLEYDDYIKSQKEARQLQADKKELLHRNEEISRKNEELANWDVRRLLAQIGGMVLAYMLVMLMVQMWRTTLCCLTLFLIGVAVWYKLLVRSGASKDASAVDVAVVRDSTAGPAVQLCPKP